MNSKRWITLMIVLVAVGSTYPIGSSSNNMDFCIWGIECGDGDYDSLKNNLIFTYNFESYNFTESGVVDRNSTGGEPYTKLFQSLTKVISISRKDYQEVIEVVSIGEDFDEIYKLNMKIFVRRYTTSIDESSPTGEYIQNIGELALNGYMGDCDDYALVLYLIAKERGLDVRYVVGANTDSGHAWIQIKVDEGWKDYDSTSYNICDDCVSSVFYDLYYFSEEEHIEDSDDE